MTSARTTDVGSRVTPRQPPRVAPNGDAKVLDPEETKVGPAAALKALANDKRLALLRFVMQPRSIEEISRHFKVARQTAQEHLDQLMEHGFVEPTRGKGERGPVTKYVVAVARVFDVYDRLGSELGVLGALTEEQALRSPTARMSPTAFVANGLGHPRIAIVHGMRIGNTVDLQGAGPWLIGRDPAAHLCLDYDSYVSHRQAEIRRTAKGFELVDALSTNGTFLDWAPVPRGTSVPLEHGSLIRIGKTLLLFRQR